MAYVSRDLHSFSRGAIISALTEMGRSAFSLALIDQQAFGIRNIPRDYDFYISILSFTIAFGLDLLHGYPTEERRANPQPNYAALFGIVFSNLFIEGFTLVNTRSHNTREALRETLNPFYRHNERLAVSIGILAFCLAVYGLILAEVFSYDDQPHLSTAAHAHPLRQASEDPSNPPEGTSEQRLASDPTVNTEARDSTMPFGHTPRALSHRQVAITR